MRTPLLLCAIGCASPVPPTPTPTQNPEHNPLGDSARVVEISQLRTPKLDLLVALDNTPTMDEERADMVTLWPNLIDALNADELDSRVGVVPFSSDVPDSFGILSEFDDQRWVDPGVEGAADLLIGLADLPTDNSEKERGLDLVHTALEVLGETDNAGFRRPNADLHVVFITDEEDQSQEISRSDFIQWIRSVGGSTPSASSIVSPNPVCPLAQSPGDEYIATTNAVGGVFWSICSVDFEQMAQSLIDISASREHTLGHLPVEDTLTVEIHADGVVMPGVRDEDWVYDDTRVSILLTEPPPVPSEIQVSYVPLLY